MSDKTCKIGEVEKTLQEGSEVDTLKKSIKHENQDQKRVCRKLLAEETVKKPAKWILRKETLPQRKKMKPCNIH